MWITGALLWINPRKNQMDLDTKDEVSELRLRKATYEQALIELRATIEKVQQTLHESHPLTSLMRGVRELELLILGCDSRIKRIEAVGR
jgi:hypothetical protein